MDPKEANIYYSILIAAIIIGAIIIYFTISIVRQQRKNLELHRLNIIAEINTLEKERSRMASDLHDDLGPQLAAIKMMINSFELPDKNDKDQLKKTNEQIDQILKRIREISFDLMPASLLRKGIVTALREFIDSLNNHKEITFKIDAEDNIQLDPKKSVNLYRITQEIIHNSIKHSRATEFLIHIKSEKTNLLLTLSDNGKGFDFDMESTKTLGFGLRGISSRIELIDGKMYLDSNPKKGTTYNFEIPL